jgi:tRNA(Glu) U13 pseudouridine synthase TruD
MLLGLPSSPVSPYPPPPPLLPPPPPLLPPPPPLLPPPPPPQEQEQQQPQWRRGPGGANDLLLEQARDAFWRRGDAAEALRLLPRHCVVERSVLTALLRNGAAARALAAAAKGSLSPADAVAPGAFASALAAVPRGMRRMYLHAWQSALWNAAASARVALHGVERVVEGDLVVLAAGAAAAGSAGGADDGDDAFFGDEAGAADEEGGGEPADGDDEEEGESAAKRLKADNGGGGGGNGRPSSSSSSSCRRPPLRVHRVTAEEAASGRHRIEDVVLPLPGSRVRYPCARGVDARLYARLAATGALLGNGGGGGGGGGGGDQGQGVALEFSPAQLAQQAEHEKRVRESGTEDEYARALDAAYAAAVGLEPGSAEARAAAAGAASAAAEVARSSGRGATPNSSGVDPAFTQSGLTGDYRRLVHVPRDLSWRLLRYSDPDDDSLTETDMDRAMGKGAGGGGGGSAVGGGAGGGAGADGDAPAITGSGPLLALDLSFDLPPSCYATMLVRELTKACTGKGAHARLSAAVAKKAAAEAQAAAAPA